MGWSQLTCQQASLHQIVITMNWMLGKYRHKYYHLSSPATLMTALSAMSSLRIDRGLIQGQAHTAGLQAAVSAAGNIGILQSLITCLSSELNSSGGVIIHHDPGHRETEKLGETLSGDNLESSDETRLGLR